MEAGHSGLSVQSQVNAMKLYRGFPIVIVDKKSYEIDCRSSEGGYEYIMSCMSLLCLLAL